MSDELRISSEAMRRADSIVSAFSKRLYGDSFDRTEREGRKTVEIADVDAVAAELAVAGIYAPPLTDAEAIGHQVTDEFGRPTGFLQWSYDSQWPKNQRVPLYLRPQPVLTDEERDAIHFMFRHAAQSADHDPFPDSADYISHHKVISAMMERRK